MAERQDPTRRSAARRRSAPRRPLALLDFAIAASAAVVPVMLGMLLLVSVVLPMDGASTLSRSGSDRYVSVRHVAALKTFEAAIVARGAQRRTPGDADELAAQVRLVHAVECLQRAAQRGQGVLEFVRDVGGEALHRIDALAQRPAHVRDGAG